MQADLTVLIFELDEHRFALEARDVLEVVRAVQPTRLAQTPDVIEGVINVRGRVAALLDLRARFDLPRRAIAPSDTILLCEVGARLVGLRVDRTVELSTLAASSLAELKEVTSGATLVRGALALPDGVILLCDLQAFLSESEQLALSRALRQAPEQQGALS